MKTEGHEFRQGYKCQEGDQRQNSRWKEVQGGAVHVPRLQKGRGARVCQLESQS